MSAGGKRGRGAPGKTIVFGMKERGGDTRAEVILDVKKATLRAVTLEKVKRGSIVSTDELMSYGLLDGDGYKHGMVKHGAKEWSYYEYRHNVFHNTNAVESFWKLFKTSVRSTHVHVSAKYYGPLSRGVHFPHEPPRGAKRDVRPFDRGGLINREMASLTFAGSAGPIPRLSSCWIKSPNRLFFIATFRLS